VRCGMGQSCLRSVRIAHCVGFREATPSFALMDVQGPVIVTYVYQLVDGEVSCYPIENTSSDHLPSTLRGTS